ncbi:VanZ family protein [Leifsonia sp. YIM 134122]|uniref:VanZ family protein n=1 Tax=Leifsonia stereocauli TaxID=3134136 RepID=A0ABU9W6J5_9MICO
MNPSQRRLLAGVLLAVYLVVLALVVLWPEPVDKPANHEVYASIIWFHEHGFAWVTYDTIEFTSNVVMFLPFGIIMTVLLGRRRWWISTLAAVALSSAIELVQLLALPDRYPSVRDVIANSTGALIGSLLVLLIGTLIARRGRRVRVADRGIPIPAHTSH